MGLAYAPDCLALTFGERLPLSAFPCLLSPHLHHHYNNDHYHRHHTRACAAHCDCTCTHRRRSESRSELKQGFFPYLRLLVTALGKVRQTGRAAPRTRVPRTSVPGRHL